MADPAVANRCRISLWRGTLANGPHRYRHRDDERKKRLVPMALGSHTLRLSIPWALTRWRTPRPVGFLWVIEEGKREKEKEIERFVGLKIVIYLDRSITNHRLLKSMFPVFRSNA